MQERGGNGSNNKGLFRDCFDCRNYIPADAEKDIALVFTGIGFGGEHVFSNCSTRKENRCKRYPKEEPKK